MSRSYISLAALMLFSACSVGPDYIKPQMTVPPGFKEAQGWKPGTPMDAIDRGAWWSVYQDPLLDRLEKQIDISNQNLQQAEASYRAAVALADQTRAGLFPTVIAGPSVTRSGTGSKAATSYNLSTSASWSVDIWGRIRRAVERDEADAQASAADLASARLSAQSELATDYFALRVQDALQRLLDQTVANDEKVLTIVQNQYKVGVAAMADVLSAQTQLEGVRANAINAGLKRTQLEHAIAVLTGQAPANFSITAEQTVGRVPLIPAEIPSVILQRRPDIASAERQMAAANANIGVAEAAYYPDLNLSASYGLVSAAVGDLFTAGSTLWSLGATASETVVDFGARSAASDQARAQYDQSVAFYKQTVLTAFQNVEDNLAAQRILSDQEKAQSLATADARKSEKVTLNQYKAGIVPYNNVLSAQIAALQAEQSSLSVLGDQLAASVALIEALGGGWDASQLDKPITNPAPEASTSQPAANPLVKPTEAPALKDTKPPFAAKQEPKHAKVPVANATPAPVVKVEPSPSAAMAPAPSSAPVEPVTTTPSAPAQAPPAQSSIWSLPSWATLPQMPKIEVYPNDEPEAPRSRSNINQTESDAPHLVPPPNQP